MSENTSGKFPTVFGYIAESERIALQRCVLETSDVPGDALEIGSLRGLSALLILSVIESHKTLICMEKGEVETLSNNLTRFQLGERAAIVNQDFNEFPPVAVPPLSFAFVDHSHTYDDNIAAFNRFWPHVSSGGLFAFHDYQDPNWRDGTTAIDELIRDHKLTIHIRGGSFIAFKKP